MEKAKEFMNNVLSKETLLPLSLVITIIAAIVGYAVHTERRMTKIEALIETHVNAPQIHYEGFRGMKEEYMPRKEAELQFDQIKETLERIEKKLD